VPRERPGRRRDIARPSARAVKLKAVKNRAVKVHFRVGGGGGSSSSGCIGGGVYSHMQCAVHCVHKRVVYTIQRIVPCLAVFVCFLT